jgi:predicted Holliday junction resolvase-like endonuclease
MWLFITIALVIILIIQTYRMYTLKEIIKTLNEMLEFRGSAIADEVRTSSLLRQRLTESIDKVASLEVTINTQSKLIEKLQTTPIVPSTQYPVAPPDITKGIPVKDKRKHFIKK